MITDFQGMVQGSMDFSLYWMLSERKVFLLSGYFNCSLKL